MTILNALKQNASVSKHIIKKCGIYSRTIYWPTGNAKKEQTVENSLSMSVLNTHQCFCILTLSKYNAKITGQIYIIYRPKKAKNSLLVATKLSVNVKAGNIFKMIVFQVTFSVLKK